MIETEGIPRLNSTSHDWVKHPTRLIARFAGAGLKKQKGRQSPFWTVCGPYPCKKASGSLELDRVFLLAPPGSFLGRLRPVSFEKASGLLFGPSAGRILQKGFRQPRTGSGFRTHASRLLFGPSAARIPQKGFRQPRTGPLHTSGYLFQAVTAWILQNGLCGSPTGSALSVSSRGLIF